MTRSISVRTEVCASLPAWFTRVQPPPKGHVVTVRRECLVILFINLRALPALPGQQPVIWKSLVIPSTAGVKTENYRGERDALHLSLRVRGAGTKVEYNAVCGACDKREGKKKGTPSF